MNRELSAGRGLVSLVGAGPGDPMLLTRRGAERLAAADAVVYDGLVHPAIFELIPSACERIYAGKKHTGGAAPLTQDAINSHLVALAREGKRVVRLKGGDPFVFGRGAEECRALTDAGVPFEIVPGVTAATAVPAYAGIPLTDRDYASTVAFATGHEAAGKPDSDVDWRALARAGTVVLFMALKTARECADRLIAAGREPDTPAAAIYWGTTARQRTIVAPLRELGDATGRAGLVPPVLLVVGEVVRQRESLAWLEKRPLWGIRVAVTRRREQAGEICRVLAELGAEPIVIPATRIAPPGPEEVRVATAAMGRLGSYDWVMFSSANAVSRCFEELAASGRDARALGGVRVACVGDKTAEELSRRGIRADLVPARADASGAADALVDALGAAVAGARILVVRASGGREEAVSRLERAGASIASIALYRSVTADPADPEIRSGLERLKTGDVDALAVFAPSQVRALFELLGDDAADILARCRAVAAIGETTRAALRDRGVEVTVVPDEASGPALAAGLAEHFSQEDT